MCQKRQGDNWNGPVGMLEQRGEDDRRLCLTDNTSRYSLRIPLLVLSFASRPFTTPYYPFPMKSLRKSLNGHKDHHHISTPSPLPTLAKPTSAVQPPKKVIRALGPYKSNAPQELSFEKGDFFHVLHDNGGLWYEAHNPMTGARGLVPSHLFEEFAKGAAT